MKRISKDLLAAQAAFIEERRCGGSGANVTEEPARLRLSEWRRIAAREDDRRFASRLAHEGLSQEQALRSLSTPEIPFLTPVPAWVDQFTRLLESVGAVLAEGRDVPHAELVGRSEEELDRAIASELMWPFAEVALARLLERSPSASALLSTGALHDLRGQLVSRLTLITSPSLAVEAGVYSVQNSDFRHAPDGKPPLRSFVAFMRLEGFYDFFVAYPVLARLIVEEFNRFLDSTMIVCDRLASDLDVLVDAFGEPIDRVVRLQSDLSDPHNGGQTVTRLTFGSGWSVLYKPRSMGLDGAWQDLLIWLNSKDTPLKFRVLTVVVRHGYGWMEAAEELPCVDEEETRRYFFRAGMLGCVLHALGATDAHYENVIAEGEDPLFIDAETLLRPAVSAKHLDAPESAYSRLSESILATGLFPNWQPMTDGRAMDLSGLGGFIDLRRRDAEESALRTDPEGAPHAPELRADRRGPMLGVTQLNPADYVDEISDGFAQMFTCLLANRESLLAPLGPLVAMRGIPVRYVLRPTETYLKLIEHSLEPKAVKDAVDRDLVIEWLARAHLDQLRGDRVESWRIFEAERSAVRALDVPIFFGQTNGTGLFAESGLIQEDFFAGPSYEATERRIAGLTRADLELQLRFLKSSLHAFRGRSSHQVAEYGSTARLPTMEEASAVDSAPLSADEASSEAIEIGRAILASRFDQPDGSTTWIALGLDTSTGRYRLAPLDGTFLTGNAGVALALAELEQIDSGQGFGEVAVRALSATRRDLLGVGRVDGFRNTLGGGDGLGGLLFATASVGALLGREDIFSEAQTAARTIRPDLIRADRRYDVVGGAAGVILALSGIYLLNSDEAILELAKVCGDHLLESRVRSAEGPRVWASAGPTALTGFSHGAAGIAYALLRLYALTGVVAYRQAAREAIEYEACVYSCEEGNWPDLRENQPDKGPAFMNSWCHGAAGIALARLAGLPALDTVQVRTDIDRGIEKIARDGIMSDDHICCGNFGRIFGLMEADRLLNRPDLGTLARRWAMCCVRRSKNLGGYTTFGSVPHGPIHPSLFWGIAGVALTLLDIADPKRRRTPLLWSPDLDPR